MAALVNHPTPLFPRPDIIYVDEDYSVKPPPYGSIENLIESLKQNGPLVAIGKMGPEAYKGDPSPLKDKIDGEAIYRWRPGSFDTDARSIPVILLGAEKEKNYVYYTPAYDATNHSKSLIRAYTPSVLDEKVYVISYDNFLKRSLVDLHPICPQAGWLFTKSPESLLDEGTTEEKCKRIGQEIFDHYKTRSGGLNEADRSQDAKEALQRICEAARILGQKGSKGAIERVWDGVGDHNWQWRA